MKLLFETICATGHRPNKIPGGWRNYRNVNDNLIKKLSNHIITLHNKYDTTDILSGMALGWDTLVAIATIKARQSAKQIRLVACVPCYEQECKWYRNDQEVYRYLLKEADEVIYVTPGTYTDNPKCMWERNQYMVQKATGILAYYNKLEPGLYYAAQIDIPRDFGGTVHCLHYARRWARENGLEVPIKNYYAA